MPETKQLVAKVLLDHLFTKRFFDICNVAQLCELAGRPINTPAYRVLHGLHCVDYQKMPPELLEQLPQLVNECLRPPPRCVAVDIALDGVVFDHG